MGNDWFWDSVRIHGACLSWEECACAYTVVCFWPTGKRMGVFPVCPECGEWFFTVAVVACVN